MIKLKDNRFILSTNIKKEMKGLKNIYKLNHIHLVCKALYKQKNGSLALMLSPSSFEWKMIVNKNGRK